MAKSTAAGFGHGRCSKGFPAGTSKIFKKCVSAEKLPVMAHSSAGRNWNLTGTKSPEKKKGLAVLPAKPLFHMAP